MPRAKKTPWYAAGLHFECIQCGNCCSGPGEGYIWVTKPEIKLIAEHLEMAEPEFRKKYIRRVCFRTTIIESRQTKDCIFLNHGLRGRQKVCGIYSVRPNQCRTWPFWSANLKNPVEWNNAVRKCVGINRGRFYSFEEIEKNRKSNKWWLNAKTQKGS